MGIVIDVPRDLGDAVNQEGDPAQEAHHHRQHHLAHRAVRQRLPTKKIYTNLEFVRIMGYMKYTRESCYYMNV